MESKAAAELTRAAITYLSDSGSGLTVTKRMSTVIDGQSVLRDPTELLREAARCVADGDYRRAVAVYQDLLEGDPHNIQALGGLGTALCHLGRFKEAETCLRQAVDAMPTWAQAQNNLGVVLRALGRFAQAEISIRRAVELDSTDISFLLNLAHTLLVLGRTQEAEACFASVAESEPRRVEALVGRAHAARLEGRFGEAEAMFKQTLAINPRSPDVLASLASLRKMSAADIGWLQSAEALAASGIPLTSEVSLRFAIGKYWDDLGEFGSAFRSYRHGNELLRTTVGRYNREARTRFVDDMVRVYTPEAIRQAGTLGCGSRKPVFVVGMPRSGTSLVEQIIASHPDAHGAGELGFWTEVLLANASVIRRGLLPEPIREKLAVEYLRILNEHSNTALRVVDKAPVNSEYLGVIHSVFPFARIIYVHRNPIDTCLSCYLQYLSPALSYTMDLSDLAHYYREHYRQIAHWRAALPPGTILDVPYEGLVANQEAWTRKVLDFLELQWNARCLEFHMTKRPVLTSSNWQVRQKIYSTSVERWRHYEQFVGPLIELMDLGSRRPV